MGKRHADGSRHPVIHISGFRLEFIPMKIGTGMTAAKILESFEEIGV